ncbi:probable mitochondrial genome maintenance protein MGM101 [Phialocephala subalpina]|uniref:Mitochondrial genome maintenance protein MGM101 n=1 Tax=Phialocephala subalpina TaxID=576137 RepID=A0A1L7X7P4_9HELO|nr:probable mitochondrial genome maintenance protein MGM101 [Phialocephala subalpina]
MATLLPRAARSAFAEASAGNFLRLSRSSRGLRAISTSPRKPATASTYVRKDASASKPPPPAISTSTPPKPTPSTSKSKPADSLDDQSPIKDMTQGLADEPLILNENEKQVDWTRSFHGLSAQPFSEKASEILMAAIPFDDVEVKPDGIIYLPEIKYRRILNRAFGPGGWGLAPRGETIVTGKSITREYALVAHGRLVSVARGEQDYFSPEGIPTATEGCKSNALMRCCKDLGVASELWDPRYIRTFMKEKAKQVWCEHVVTKKKKQIWIRKDEEPRYPYQLSKFGA